MQLVLVVQRRDPLRDRRPELRQRHPAHPSQRQPVQALARGLHELQPLHLDGNHRLRVPLQHLTRPGFQLRCRRPARVRRRVLDDAVGRRVPVPVGRGQVDVVVSDRIEARVHPRPVDVLRDRPQVPSAPQLTPDRSGPPRDVQPERVARQVVGPFRVRQRVRHRLQRVEQRVPVKLVRVRYAVVERAQRPVPLAPQDVFHRLPRRAGLGLRVPGDRRRRHLAEQDPVLQRGDHVLELHRRRVRRVGRPDGLHPPHDARARVRVVQQPALRPDPGHVRRRHRRRAFAFLQAQAQRLQRDLPRPVQAVPIQEDHAIYLP